MEIQDKIATRIREIRTAKNLSQEAVAWRSEVNRAHVNYVENSKRNVTVKVLERIVVHGLEMTMRDFFDNDLFNGKSKKK